MSLARRIDQTDQDNDRQDDALTNQGSRIADLEDQVRRLEQLLAALTTSAAGTSTGA